MANLALVQGQSTNWSQDTIQEICRTRSSSYPSIGSMSTYCTGLRIYGFICGRTDLQSSWFLIPGRCAYNEVRVDTRSDGNGNYEMKTPSAAWSDVDYSSSDEDGTKHGIRASFGFSCTCKHSGYQEMQFDFVQSCLWPRRGHLASYNNSE
jgi:hypothetical protein